jgi:hypothetical protein
MEILKGLLSLVGCFLLFFVFALFVGYVKHLEAQDPLDETDLDSKTTATLRSREQVSIHCKLTVRSRRSRHTRERLEKDVAYMIRGRIERWAFSHDRDTVLGSYAELEDRLIFVRWPEQELKIIHVLVSLEPTGQWGQSQVQRIQHHQTPSPNRLQEHEYLAYERLVRKRIAGKLKDIDPTELE